MEVMTMNKKDLINEVAEVLLSKKEAKDAVDCMLSKIIEALSNNESVSLIGFGTFKVNKQKAREGRNPQTGETIQIEEKMVPKFVPGKAMKEAVNQ
jgi:DNA-binding protein HU-beta